MTIYARKNIFMLQFTFPNWIYTTLIKSDQISVALWTCHIIRYMAHFIQILWRPTESITKLDNAQIDATKHKTRIRTSLEKIVHNNLTRAEEDKLISVINYLIVLIRQIAFWPHNIAWKWAKCSRNISHFVFDSQYFESLKHILQ